MSDYGGDDDFDDFDDDWLYVEDEYTAADDLAEHALPSPPPTTYADEDAVEDFDLFDYFNDIEYASDGYDDGNFQPHDSEAVKTGQKRKRSEGNNQGRKKQKLGKSAEIVRSVARTMEVSPIVWRARKERGVAPKKMLDEDAKPVTLLKDWRTQLADAPSWSNKKSRITTLDTILPDVEALDRAAASDLNTPGDEGDDLQDGEDGPPAIDQGMLLAALRANLAEAGGPLANMDEQQLLQFAMRMMSGDDAGDDIAGELADNMLGQGEEEEDEDEDGDPSAEHQAWLAKMKGSAGNAGENEAEASTAKTPKSDVNGKPPTPPSSDEKRNLDMMDIDRNEAHDSGVQMGVSTTVSTRKRKAGSGTGLEIKSTETKKQRAGRSFDAPTAASQARSVSATKSSRPGKGKRS